MFRILSVLVKQWPVTCKNTSRKCWPEMLDCWFLLVSRDSNQGVSFYLCQSHLLPQWSFKNRKIGLKSTDHETGHNLFVHTVIVIDRSGK